MDPELDADVIEVPPTKDQAAVAAFVQQLRDSGVRRLHWKPGAELEVEFWPVATRRRDDE